ncbi:MAG TPA: DEAD/DEAH box helicase [Lentimicrobium sp.]|nr:DEAD/DEAH box helicase [Lentimicrobium sp.]
MNQTARLLLMEMLAGILSDNPDSNKYELQKLINQESKFYFSTTDINNVLYGAPSIFVKNDYTLPLWRLSGNYTKSESESVCFNNDKPNLLLYRGHAPRAWQTEAMLEWINRGRRGVVEAVTGTGKTAVGIMAAADAVARGLSVVVLVPSTELLEQWHKTLKRDLPDLDIGKRCSGEKDTIYSHHIVVVTVQTAMNHNMLPDGVNGLLIADEVHRYGSPDYSRSLLDNFRERLGLTATFDRNDEGIEKILLPYFSSRLSGSSGVRNVIHGCGYARGRQEGILAPFIVGLISLELNPDDQEEYFFLDDSLRKKRRHLIEDYGCPAEPFGEFMLAVKKLKEGKNEDIYATKVASQYLKHFRKRRDLLSDNSVKIQALERLVPLFFTTEKALIFTETKEASIQSAELLSQNNLEAFDYGSHLNKPERKERLVEFANGNIKVLSAPKCLDEGIDVAEADLGVILSASQTKRQMIQRMGRIIRPKKDGRPAAFIILYFRNTSEDPDFGAYEGFLSEMYDHAADVKEFPINSGELEILVWYLGGLSKQAYNTE